MFVDFTNLHGSIRSIKIFQTKDLRDIAAAPAAWCRRPTLADKKKTGRPGKIDPDIVKTIHVSIFGFSRGATQARAFANWLIELCRLDARLAGRGDEMTLGGFKLEVDFLGLFDTVLATRLS